jgi:uncharacterized tellurite resistance protein B-like protein
MVSADLARIALELPPEERLDLARRLVESVLAPTSLNEAIAEGIRRIEDVVTGHAKGLTEQEYRAALK